ncbi:hypothetical protein MLD38_007109 [Melastoma candidum]|uniref:Uncharacterized protein n=1 Tax=Melastoma candidum TaxID=119954 RepID=A0ACB9RTU5_9MYRT|nr:hypothetical protein MLD38_007109 [Melastoma candidum]
MAIGFFSLALFLFLGLDFENGSPTPAYAAPSSEGVEITYGSVLKLMHEKTRVRLHSHDVPYGSGSQQQSVTGFPSVDDSNSYWIVRPQPGTSAKQGALITSGTIIRLQHMVTRKWLHSHLHASPISGNLEVSCYGGETESDTGDCWRILIEGSGKTWRQDQRIRLQHVDTSGYLHSHDKKYQRIAGGQQESNLAMAFLFNISWYVASEKSAQITFGWLRKACSFQSWRRSRNIFGEAWEMWADLHKSGLTD